jgi:6-pyruvoyltetrahydropterin/6-carboxytetrahydropterin synthase
MIRLTRRYRFSASHKLHSSALSASENAATYGKCNNPHGHGHDYALEVGVTGVPDPASGRVVDVRALDRLVDAEVLSKLRHRDLNAEAAELSGLVPTSENLAAAILRMLEASWRRTFPDGRPALDRVRIHETRRNLFEISKLP